MNKAIRVYQFQPLNCSLPISQEHVFYDVKRGNVLNPETSQGLVATTVEQLQQSTS